jgi:hypothetical protein
MNQNFESKTWQKNDIKNRQTTINKKFYPNTSVNELYIREGLS